MASSNEAPSGPAHMLSLPRELRDEIYAYVFDLTITAPDSLDDYRQTREDVSLTKDGKPSFIDFKIAPPQPSWMLLGSCNRQVHQEILSFIHKRTTWSLPADISEDLVYELGFHLDAGLQNADPGSIIPRIFLNWTTIPALPILYAKSIRINITGEGYHALRKPWGVPLKGLYRCLYNLFAHGASFAMQSETRLPIRVEELRVDLYDCFLEEERDEHDLAIRQLRRVLRALVYGGSLRSRVGVATLLHYGVLQERWVVSDFRHPYIQAERFGTLGWTALPEIEAWEEMVTLHYAARLFGEE